MLHLLATAPDAAGIAFSSPLVLGPLAAFVFAVFIAEIVVLGKTHRREVEENQRLREVVEKVIPLAESMVETGDEMVRATTRITDTVDRVFNAAVANRNSVPTPE